MKINEKIDDEELLHILKNVALVNNVIIGLNECCPFEICPFGKRYSKEINKHSDDCPILQARYALSILGYDLKKYHILYEKQLGNKVWQAQSNDVLEYDKDDAKIYIAKINAIQNMNVKNIVIVSEEIIHV